MQEIVRNSFNVADPLRVPMHLRPASNGDLFNHQSMLNSESEDCNSESDDYNVHFNPKPSQDFGLGYWMKHTNHHLYESQIPHSKSPNFQAFIPKTNPRNSNNNSNSNKRANRSDVRCSESSEKSKKSKHNSKVKKAKEKKSATSKFNSSKSDYNIPRLKIPKDIVKKYLKTLSPLSSSTSSSSDSESSYSQKINHKIDKTNRKSKHTNQSKSTNNLSDMPLSHHIDSSCLQKSFLSSNYSKPQSHYLLSVASHDIMHLSMTIDESIFDVSSLPVINGNKPDSTEITDSLQLELADKNSLNIISNKCETYIENNDTTTNSNDNNNIDNMDHSSDLLSDEDRIGLSTLCDYRLLERSTNKNIDPTDLNDFESFNYLTPTNSRKRLLNERSDSAINSEVATKKKTLESTNYNHDLDDLKLPNYPSAAKYVRLLMTRMKYFEEMVHEKYCLSQPNAMKFLAQNHAFNWESYKSDLSQLHLVPCEFIAEIFHRALHCFGLEKRTLKETMNFDSSPNNRLDPTHFTEYKKVRDEYSFSLKRARYGIGVIDDLFKRKINFQSTQPNSDVMIVRKWKHLIYYLCLQAKAVFMTKEMQYHNYANYVTQPGAFDGDCNVLFNTTPTAARNSSSLAIDAHSKFQNAKDGSRISESKFIKTTPEHLCQFDMDVSPHSYDSGKGSSIRLSSNGNSQVSGWQTTSSLNSTPHSLNEAQLNLPGFHMYRIDEYLKAANEFIHFLPETLQLHNKIISKIGLEPNANSSDNMMRFINYTEVCQQICKQDAMSECLQRLLSQAVRL